MVLPSHTQIFSWKISCSWQITVDSFSGMEQESILNRSGTTQQTSWNNMLHPVESQISNYILSANNTYYTCGDAIDEGFSSFSGWNMGESSSSLNQDNQMVNDDLKMEHSWSSSFSPYTGAGRWLEEMQCEVFDILPPGNANDGLCAGQVTSRPLLVPSSTLSRIPQNTHPNVTSSSKYGIQIDGQPNVSRPGRLETEQIQSATDDVGASSRISGQLVSGKGSGSNSSLSWGLSCKTKALEGTSCHFYSGGSSSCFPQADNCIWHDIPARYNNYSSLIISTLPMNLPSIGVPPEHLNPSIGVGIRELASDAFSSSVVGNAESSSRNFSRRKTSGYQQESLPFSLSSTGSARHSNACTPYQSSISLPVSDPFSWNGSSCSIAVHSSNSVNLPRERGTTLREEGNLRGNSRNTAEYPMLVSVTETRNVAQDPTTWILTAGNLVYPSGVLSVSHIGPDPSARTFPTPGWIPSGVSLTQNQQRLSEFSPWSLFPSVNSESVSQSDPYPSFSSNLSASSQETMMSSGSDSQSHLQFSRSAFLEESQDEDFFDSPHSFQVLAADFEGRNRLISEDYMLFDPSLYHGMADLHDRHQGMRLDIDNMSYEELLALEERIGDVKTGLSEETISEIIKQRKYTTRVELDLEPCCVCQEEYAAGDVIGTLTCGHDFHSECIKQWLMQKNLCPMCKTPALVA